MAEFLDIYDENGKHLGTEDRNIVHKMGLWHKTIHCWIVKDNTNILFQKRSHRLLDNPSKLYTTASGHLQAGETLDMAFKREISEELGISISNPQKLFEVIYKTDFTKRDGTPFHDRVFCNIFMANCNMPLTEYHPQTEELDGIVEVDIKNALSLFKGDIDEIPATCYTNDSGKYSLKTQTLHLNDFLCNPTETHYEKYGKILEAILKVKHL